MGVKRIALEDIDGKKVRINPASVCSIHETDYYNSGEAAQPVTVVSTMSFSYNFKIPIEELDTMIWG